MLPEAPSSLAVATQQGEPLPPGRQLPLCFSGDLSCRDAQPYGDLDHRQKARGVLPGFVALVLRSVQASGVRRFLLAQISMPLPHSAQDVADQTVFRLR